MRRYLVATLILASMTGCSLPPIPTPAEQLQARIDLIDVEHDACVRLGVTDADMQECVDIARARLHEEAGLVWDARFPAGR
jgi:hypothetical protein